MTEMSSPRLSPDHHPRINSSTTPPSVSPSSAYSSSTLPPSFVSSSSTAQSSGQSSSIRPSTKPLTSPTLQSSTLPSCSSAQASPPTAAPNASTLPPASAFTPICPASPYSSAESSSLHLPSTPPSSVPPSPQVPQHEPRTSCNQLTVSSSHNSLDGEVQVSDIYFVSLQTFFAQAVFLLFSEHRNVEFN